MLLVAACAHAPPARPSQATRPTAPTHAATPRAHPRPFAEGLASFYGPGFWGRKTASGEVLKKSDLTAASRTLPFGTCLVVENTSNGRRVRVRVNDRGPYVGGRILDVSQAAARVLGMLEKGLATVRLFRCSR